MWKITKKYLMEKAINNYSEDKIEKANKWKFIATFKDWSFIKNEFSSFNYKKKITKREYILKQIRSALHNTTSTESNKVYISDKSSNNIENIEIYLK